MEAREPRLYRFKITYLLSWQRQWSLRIGARRCVPCPCLCRRTTQQVVFVCVSCLTSCCCDPRSECGTRKKKWHETECTRYYLYTSWGRNRCVHEPFAAPEWLIYHYFIILSARCALNGWHGRLSGIPSWPKSTQVTADASLIKWAEQAHIWVLGSTATGLTLFPKYTKRTHIDRQLRSPNASRFLSTVVSQTASFLCNHGNRLPSSSTM